jgi:Cysteine-rich secretory protein family
MKYIIQYLLFTNLVFAQQPQYQLVFNKDKTTAKIIDSKKNIILLTVVQTVEVNELLEAISMKVYKNQNEMLVDFMAYLKFEKENKNYFRGNYARIEIPKLSTETIKILQVKSVVEINRFRKTQNLPKLLFNETLQEVAQDYADYCTKNNWRLLHTSKDGISCFERIAAKMPQYRGTENLYCGYGTPKETIALLITSPDHLANLKCDMQYVAVGVSQYADGSLVYVQNFAKKRPF